MPGKQTRVLCPVCREPMPPDETECHNCGAFVVDEALERLCRALGIDRGKASQLVEAGFRHPLQLHGRDVDDVLDGHESGLLFLCTNCGSFVAGTDSRCARCGAEFEAGPREAVQLEDDILDLTICTNCGADNEADAVECDTCGDPFPGARSTIKMETPASDERPLDLEAETLAEFDALADELEAFDALSETAENENRKRRDAFDALARELETFDAPINPAEAAEVEAATAHAGPAATTPRRVVKRTAEIRFRKSSKRRGTRSSKWFRQLRRNFSGTAVVALAVGVLASHALGQRAILWGLAPMFIGLGSVALLDAYPFTRFRRMPRDLVPIVVGAIVALVPAVGALAEPGMAESTGTVLSLTSMLPLGVALRRLWRGRYRLVVAASGAFTLSLWAVVAASGLPYAGSGGWAAGYVSGVAWPAAIAFDEARRRFFAEAMRDRILRAETHLVGRDGERSVAVFDEAIRLASKAAPRYDLPWYGKGAALTILGRYDEALRAIDRALDLNPMNEVAWVNKGNALTRMGRLVDALRSFNAAIKVNPTYEVAWNNKGNALARLGQFEEALECYGKALELDATYQGAWVNRGYVLTKLGRFDEAAACADRALELAASGNG